MFFSEPTVMSCHGDGISGHSVFSVCFLNAAFATFVVATRVHVHFFLFLENASVQGFEQAHIKHLVFKKDARTLHYFIDTIRRLAKKRLTQHMDHKVHSTVLMKSDLQIALCALFYATLYKMS